MVPEASGSRKGRPYLKGPIPVSRQQGYNPRAISNYQIRIAVAVKVSNGEKIRARSSVVVKHRTLKVPFPCPQEHSHRGVRAARRVQAKIRNGQIQVTVQVEITDCHEVGAKRCCSEIKRVAECSIAVASQAVHLADNAAEDGHTQARNTQVGLAVVVEVADHHRVGGSVPGEGDQRAPESPIAISQSGDYRTAHARNVLARGEHKIELAVAVDVANRHDAGVQPLG